MYWKSTQQLIVSVGVFVSSVDSEVHWKTSALVKTQLKSYQLKQCCTALWLWPTIWQWLSTPAPSAEPMAFIAKNGMHCALHLRSLLGLWVAGQALNDKQLERSGATQAMESWAQVIDGVDEHKKWIKEVCSQVKALLRLSHRFVWCACAVPLDSCVPCALCMDDDDDVCCHFPLDYLVARVPGEPVQCLQPGHSHLTGPERTFRHTLRLFRIPTQRQREKLVSNGAHLLQLILSVRSSRLPSESCSPSLSPEPLFSLLALHRNYYCSVKSSADTKITLKSITNFGRIIFYYISNYRLLVGAPLAHTDQPDVERGGAVYKCNVDTADACQQIAFDRSGRSW